MVTLVAVLLAILANQRSQGVVQPRIEYKVVDTGYLRGAKVLTTQDALDEYGKAVWQLVTQSLRPQQR